jgi:hypothetical protein
VVSRRAERVVFGHQFFRAGLVDAVVDAGGFVLVADDLLGAG